MSAIDENAEGLVLRTRLFSETSLIVEWITLEFGRIATLAQGARRPKSNFAGKLDLYYRARIAFRRSRRSDLHRLADLAVIERHGGLRRNWEALRQAAYCAWLIEKTTEREAPIPESFRLLNEALGRLVRKESAAAVFAFELGLLREGGQAPSLSSARLSPGALEFLRRLDDLEGRAPDEPPARTVLKECGFWLGRAIQEMVGYLPRERALALEGEL